MTDPRLIVVDRTTREGTEAEPVLVEVDERVVTMTTDDGQRFAFDRRELDAAVHEEAA